VDFELSAPLEQKRKQFSAFCQKQIEPAAAALDRQQKRATEHLSVLAEAGFLEDLLNAHHSTEELLASAVLGEELARVCGSTYLAAATSAFWFGSLLRRFGQGPRWEPIVHDLVRGRATGAVALSEPEAGSDWTALATNATPAAKGYHLQGTKGILTNCAEATHLLLLARLPNSSAEKGLCAFVLQRQENPVWQTTSLETMGLRGVDFGTLSLHDIPAFEEALLVQGKEVLALVEEAQRLQRIIIATLALGLARRAMEEAISFAQQRQSNGPPIATYQEVHFKVAEMKTLHTASQTMLYRALWGLGEDQGEDLTRVAKLHASEACHKIVSDALQIHGGQGLLCQFPLERLFRDMRFTEILAEPSEIHRVAIARRVLDAF
jgi:butyryl-CoA dehydrogenase